MLHGDISNQAGYTIAFRLEDSVAKIPEAGVKNKVLNFIMGKQHRIEINEKYRAVMERIYRHTEYCVDLVVEEKHYDADMKEYLMEHLPFNRVVLITKETSISQRLLTGDISIYVDEDDYRRSLINSEYAIPLKDLNDYVGRVRF